MTHDNYHIIQTKNLEDKESSLADGRSLRDGASNRKQDRGSQYKLF
jgi:hypothetical protein